MLFLVPLIFVVVLLFLLIGLISAVAWLIWAGVVALAFAILAAVLVTVLLTGVAAPLSATGLLTGGAVFVLALTATRALSRRRRAERLEQRRQPRTINVTASRAPKPPEPPPPEPRDDRHPELGAAFDRLAKSADFARSRLGVVRSSCALFLDAADSRPGDADAAQFAILIRKRVPEHIDEALAACRAATALEARALLEEAIADLERLGARADKRRSALMDAGGSGRQRSLLARRLDEDPFA